MKTTPLFGILVVATALMTVCPTTAKGESSETYHTGIILNMGTNSELTELMSVPQFNSALGVLDSVEIGTMTSYSSTVTISGLEGAGGNLGASGQIYVQDPNHHFGTLLIGMNWDQDFGPLPSYSNLSGSVANDIYYIPPSFYNSTAVLSEFTGNGNFNFQITGSQAFATAVAPTTITINDATLTVTTYVTYVYTVPEPGSWALLVVGFGIMVWRRSNGRNVKEV